MAAAVLHISGRFGDVVIAHLACSVPLAATLGLPFYSNGAASLPLVRAMLYSGMSQGAALAFLISGILICQGDGGRCYSNFKSELFKPEK